MANPRELGPGEAIVEIEMHDSVVMCIPVLQRWWQGLDASRPRQAVSFKYGVSVAGLGECRVSYFLGVWGSGV